MKQAMAGIARRGRPVVACLGAGLLFVSSAPGAVTFQESVDGGHPTSSPLTLPAIPGGTDQTYVLFIATRRNNDVTSVTGGGLIWTERVEQCAGRNEQAIRLWTAQGSPGSSFQATIIWDDADPRPISAILCRYSGVDSFEDPTGENTNGEAGGCAGGLDGNTAQVTLTSTVNGAVHAIGVNHRNATVDSFSGGYTQRDYHSEGTGGEMTNLTAYGGTFDPAATDTFVTNLSDIEDWATAGIVLKPSAGGGLTGYVIGNTGTILKTSDGGSNWNTQTSGTTLDLRAVFAVDDITVYVVGYSGTILKTADGGNNWNSQTSGTTKDLRGVCFPVDHTTGYVAGSGGRIVKTTDGGSTWNSQTSGTTVQLVSVHFPVDATTGYVVGKTGTILKTTDGGSNWNSQTSGTAEGLKTVWFVDNTTGYAVGSTGTILKTSDGGSNWISQTSGTASDLFGVCFPVDATTGYAVGSSVTIRKTSDGGSNWSPQTAGSQGLRHVIFPVDATTGYAVGLVGEILKTIDGGSNWNTQTSGTTNELRGVHFPPGAGGPTLTLADHAAGQESDAFTDSGSETDAELFAFKLDPGPDTISVMLLIFRISDIAGLTDSDWAGANLEIIQDDVVVDGDIGAGETTSVGGLWVVDQAGGKITFSPSFSVSAATSYILRGTFSSLSDGDKVTIVLNPSDITTTASETVLGSTTAVTHKEGCFYVERFQQWSATGPDTWEIKDLSGAPFNVPANTVVEVAVRNSRANFERYGGVRAVGSVLDRRLLLQEAEMGGVSVVVMHVQADASSQIRHYSDATADVDFVLLGYWDCGTYVEAFQSFTAGADASWQDRDLSTYGVGSSQVAEIVLTNSDPFSEWEAGVRKKGPTRQRVLDIQEAEAGGVDTATMFVTADATANATIQVYAEDDFSITFYLVGYFTTAPRTYNELFSSIGSPATSAFWQDIALSSFGVPAQAVAEISMANMTLAAEHNMGVRENGSSRARLLALQEAEAGGGDFGRMHVTADATSTIEFYQELISDPHNFFLTGYWSATGPVTPKIIRWSEVDPFQP